MLKLWGCDAQFCLLSFLSLASLGTDTLIIVLSETKIGSRSHSNRCVSFRGCDLLPDIGQSERPGRNQVSGDNDPKKRVSDWLCERVMGLNCFCVTLCYSNKKSTNQLFKQIFLFMLHLFVQKECSSKCFTVANTDSCMWTHKREQQKLLFVYSLHNQK